jgi:GT2 family glycosyltransferase
MTTSVVVPVWLFEPWVADMTERCLALLREHSPDVEIVLVVRGEPTWRMDQQADILLRPKEPGFAHAVNLGVAESSGDVVVMVSSDTHVTAGWLEPILADLATRDGIATPFHEDCQPDGHTGFCGVLFGIRRATWDWLGGYDAARFPIRKADQDFAIRAHQAGVIPRFLSGPPAFTHVASAHSLARHSSAAVRRDRRMMRSLHGVGGYEGWERQHAVVPS